MVEYQDECRCILDEEVSDYAARALLVGGRLGVA
jgi:hypothetical protein